MLQTVTLFGTSINLCDFFNNISYLGNLLVGIFVLKEYKKVAALPVLADMYFNKKKKNSFFWNWGVVFLMVLLLLVLTVIAANLPAPYISLLFLGNRDANFFTNIYIAPVAVVLFAILLRSEPLKTLDCAAPIDAVGLIFYKIACFCEGCCYGVEWSGGMLNHTTGRVELPIQLIEAACAAVMFAVLMWLFKKKNYKNGLLYPLFMVMYCASRFISEFWRDDYPDILGPFKSYHIQCFIGLVQGVVFLVIVFVWGERISAFFTNKNRAMLKRHEAKLKKEQRRRDARHAANTKRAAKNNGKK